MMIYQQIIKIIIVFLKDVKHMHHLQFQHLGNTNNNKKNIEKKKSFKKN